MMIRRIKHLIEYVFTVSVIFLFRRVPYRLAISLGAFLGYVTYKVIGIRREVTLRNLRDSFGDKYSEEELQKIGLDAYCNFGRSVVEYALYDKLSLDRMKGIITEEGFGYFDEVQKKRKGAIWVTGHFGSWELAGAYLAKRGYPIDFLVGEQHNLRVDNLMNKQRQRMGIGIIKMGTAAKGILKSLKNNRFVAMLSDQDAGSDGAIVSFFGRPASTPKGPAAFALKAGCPLFTGFMIRRGKYRHHIVVYPPFNLEPSGDKEKDIENLTQAYTSKLEGIIREHPDQWFWPHRRWKSTS
ncbi:MAG: lysophospholipid acyltransferase family protein [Candidatus Zixiibacteriota bacterium]